VGLLVPEAHPAEGRHGRGDGEGQGFIAAELKLKHLKPPPEDARFNYLVGVFACPGPNAFESKLARLLYAGPGRFNLAFQRHTGQWVELYEGLPLQKCLETIRDDPCFIPV
jgi:hypothetical protein